MSQQYSDDDLVYIDPDAREVIKKVEWNAKENPQSLPYTKEEGSKGSHRRRKFFPWGTYRSMKRIFHLEKKKEEEAPKKTLKDVFEKPLEETFLG
ncbi:hypothetical protein HYZ98_02840 [Candidatus Peregrinibacteria bacterium]|nr:hypothetical protein [Candidatus Peregrinibacteria bacterium]